MATRRLFIGSALSLASTATLTSPAFAKSLPLKLVLDRHVSARGGSSAMDAVIAMTTDIQISEGGSMVIARYAATKAPRVAMRIDVFDGPDRVWSEGLDQDGAWKFPRGDASPSISIKGAAALNHGIIFNLYGIERIPKLGGTLEYVGRENVGVTSYHVLRATLPDGFASAFYIDPQSWLISRRRDVRPLHPDLDMTFKPLENEYSDYRSIAGVLTSFASLQRDLTTDGIVQTSVTRALVYNPPIGADRLKRNVPPL